VKDDDGGRRAVKNVNEIKLTNGETQDEWRNVERKEESKENGKNYDQVEERKRLIRAAHTATYGCICLECASQCRNWSVALTVNRHRVDTLVCPSKIYVVIVTFTHASYSWWHVLIPNAFPRQHLNIFDLTYKQ